MGIPPGGESLSLTSFVSGHEPTNKLCALRVKLTYLPILLYLRKYVM
jgi:hypothetical protein